MKAVFIIAALMVAACVPAQTPAQLPTVSSIPSTTTLDRGALSGVVQRLNIYFNVNADCTSGGYPTVRIVAPPPYGRLVVEQVMGYPDFPADNQRYRCNLNRLPGTAASYLSNPGYRGPDSATIEILFPSGRLRQDHFNILVR